MALPTPRHEKGGCATNTNRPMSPTRTTKQGRFYYNLPAYKKQGGIFL
nr:MAG TPA: hypothetical protein [Caudoviricetes sp.]